jgi:hypothetical protein
MRDQLAKLVEEPLWGSTARERSYETADAIIAALPDMVQPIAWHKSHITPWDGDYHSIPTGYTIRGIGNENYRLSHQDGFSVHNSPAAAMVAADRVERRRILSVFGITGET